MPLPKYSEDPAVFIAIHSMYMIHYLSTIYILITSKNEYIVYHRVIFIIQHLLILYINISRKNEKPCFESTLTFSIVMLSNSMGFFCNFGLMSNWFVVITNIIAVLFVTMLVYHGIKDEFLSPFDKQFEFQAKWYPNSTKWWFISEIIKTTFMICIWTELLYSINICKFCILFTLSAINIFILMLHDPFLMSYIGYMFHPQNITYFQLIQKTNLSSNQLLIRAFCIVNDKYITIQTPIDYWRYIITYIEMNENEKLRHLNKICGYNNDQLIFGYSATDIIIIICIMLDVLTPTLLLLICVDYRWEHMLLLVLLHLGGLTLFGWYGFIKEKSIPSRLQSILHRNVYYGLRKHCRIASWLKKPTINNIITEINCVQTILDCDNNIYGLTKDILLIIITYSFMMPYCKQSNKLPSLQNY